MALSKKEQTFVVFATSIGGAIEWYELFLYVYWAPLISKLFFAQDSQAVSSIKTLFVFFIGFLARPIGGFIFGHVGDKYGRKTSFIRSILLMSLPSFAMGILPSFQLGIFAPILLCVLRFLQGLPAGGELPGAMCYLAESAPANKRAFICSFSFFGPQVGVIVSMLECYFLESYLPVNHLESWGWRCSFIIGGLLGLFGFYIRHKLKESPAFKHLEENKRVLHKPIIETIRRYKKNVSLGFFASFLDVVGFYMFSVFLGIYFNNVLKISPTQNLLIAAGSLILSTITLPYLGMLGNRYKIKHLLVGSAIGMILFSYPFYLAASHSSIILTAILELILMLLLNVQFAILPALLAELFPTSTRYSGIGMSFNLCDSVIGGLTPLLALLLTNRIGDIRSFVIFISLSSIISLATFLFIQEKKLHQINTD